MIKIHWPACAAILKPSGTPPSFVKLLFMDSACWHCASRIRAPSWGRPTTIRIHLYLLQYHQCHPQYFVCCHIRQVYTFPAPSNRAYHPLVFLFCIFSYLSNVILFCHSSHPETTLSFSHFPAGFFLCVKIRHRVLQFPGDLFHFITVCAHCLYLRQDFLNVCIYLLVVGCIFLADSMAEREKRGFEKPQQKEYALVYEGEVDTFSLEDVWEKFGRRVPRDFEGHALYHIRCGGVFGRDYTLENGHAIYKFNR